MLNVWPRAFAIIAMLFAASFATACDGDGDDNDGGGGTPAATAADGGPLDEAAAGELLGKIMLQQSDVPAGWTVMSDNTVDNASAVQANPDDASLIEQCGRLLARTITYQPPDVVNAFLGGETLAFFSTATVYATADGAEACAAETGRRLAEPGALARQFGGLFIDPAAVVVQGVEWPTVGDQSFAATLTGQIQAAGTVIDLTVLVVGFRGGNVTAAVGSARSGAVPPRQELEPYVEKVQQRIAEEQ